MDDTIPMDSNLDHSSRERVQRLYNKNVELENKRRKATQARVPSDPSAWQQMRENYESIILEDHAFSEQHEIEYALWQLHYRKIEELRAHFNAAVNSTNPQNGKVPARSGPDRITKIRTQFKTFLSEATGFYHDFMLKIRAKYGLPLGYFSDDPENQIPSSKDANKSVEVKKGLISCHRCLIYLGDLARYKGLYGEGDSKARDFAAASSYYLQASSLWPSSGNPHHQLAILASYSSDELVAIYRYFRSLALESPFATARDNLIIAFEKNRQCYSQLLGDAKSSSTKVLPSRMFGKGKGKGETRQPLKDDKTEASSVQEKASSMLNVCKTFTTRFVRLNGILFTRTSLETFGEVQLMVKNDLLELLSSGPDEKNNFGSDVADSRLAIVRLVAILIFTVHNVKRESENQSYAEILQRSVLLQNAFTAVFELMGLVVERCVQLNDPTTSFLLPGVLVFVEWLACHQDVALGNELEEKQTAARSFFWNKCIVFFNKLLSSGFNFVDDDDKDETCFFNMSRYDGGESSNCLALPEDFELRGFIPLLPAQLILNFSRKHWDGGIKEKRARLQRIIAAGKALANVVRVGEEGIYFDSKVKKFILGSEPQVCDDYAINYSMELSGMELENPVAAAQLSVGAVQPKQPMYMVEGEEEDEVIVFKPSVAEKHVNGCSEDVASGFSAAKVPLPGGVGSVAGSGIFSAAALDGLSALHASVRPPTSIIDNTSGQYVQQPPMWSTVEQTAAMNGLASLNLIGNNGPAAPHSFVSFPQPIVNSIQQVAAIPSSNISTSVTPSLTGVGIDSMSIKSPSTGIKKNPVSRPVRHLGPPPGFGSLPLSKEAPMTIKNEYTPLNLHPMDDYSWLDGYRLPQSIIGFNNSINSQSTQNYDSLSSSNSSVGTVNFPFPGKQVTSSLHVQSLGNQKGGWEDYHQMSEQLKLYPEQPQHGGNQQSVGLHQGQSLWDGRFFV